ncbi:alpha/beta hydrolase [uncultured Limosilactobacillus sp.]|uniref:alpha/beta hydrolase n=1 Tax=uncultured Limosilactobacillus sp. TaxID=2837629 RepID=UPI0025FB6DEF|nr:alpha/beta hydrolase [uncultured Limosilactobacillus sp.]
MLKTLTVITKTGTPLTGRIFKHPHAQTVVILVTGIEGNIQNNPFYTVIGKKLTASGIDLIVVHTRDAFNQTNVFNQLTGQREVYGSFNEDFQDTNGDVGAYLDYAVAAGYQSIILGGQSLGANKVIHFLADHPEAPVDKFLLMSPVNVDVLRRNISYRQRAVIKQRLADGRANQRLPFNLFRWLSSTALTAHRWLTDDTLNNVHPGQQGDFSQLRRINYTGALLIGTRDHFTGGSPVHYLANINSYLPTAADNKLIYIQHAGHIYRQRENVVADKILALLTKWVKDKA